MDNHTITINLTPAAAARRGAINLTPADAADIAHALIAGRWAIVTEYGRDDSPRVVAIDAALDALALAAGLEPGVIEGLKRIIGAERCGDTCLRVFENPRRFVGAYGTVAEYNGGVMFCAVTGATLEW